MSDDELESRLRAATDQDRGDDWVPPWRPPPGYPEDFSRLDAEREAKRRRAAAGGKPVKRGREYENGPIHHANDGCTDHA